MIKPVVFSVFHFPHVSTMRGTCIDKRNSRIQYLSNALVFWGHSQLLDGDLWFFRNLRLSVFGSNFLKPMNKGKLLFPTFSIPLLFFFLFCDIFPLLTSPFHV